MTGNHTFYLASTSWEIRIATGVLLALLAGMTLWGPPVVAGIIALIYAFVWFRMRPTRFELSDSELIVRWPFPSKEFNLLNIANAEHIQREAFRKKYGWGIRIGAGGLWGGFGLLKTRKGTFEMYVSNLDSLVIVNMKQGRDLLISPDYPQQFVSTLRNLIQ